MAEQEQSSEKVKNNNTSIESTDVQQYRINQYYRNDYSEESLYENQKHIDRQNEIGIVNDNSYLALKKDNSIVSGNSSTNQEELTKDKQIKIATELLEICNRKDINLDDLLINAKKFNQQLVYLSDSNVLFNNDSRGIGNLTLGGTVIVKAWDIHLKRYVLTRRRIRTPMFSQTLNYPEIPEEYNTDLGNVNKLDTNLAELIQTERETLNKVTKEMEAAEGGAEYNQGVYNSYGESPINTDSTSSVDTNNSSANTSQGETKIINENVGNSMYCWPCPGATTITAYTGDNRNHDGWDISTSDAASKNIEICASRAGTVLTANNTDAKPYTGFGTCVVIDHGDGIRTLYGHMKQNSIVVKVGDTVSQGQKIGIMGNTGSVQSSIPVSQGGGTHLHFSIYQYDDKGNKIGFLNPGNYISANS